MQYLSPTCSEVVDFLRTPVPPNLQNLHPVPRCPADNLSVCFEEAEHKYRILLGDGTVVSEVQQSVSGVVKKYFPKDMRPICEKMVAKPGFRQSVKYRREYAPLVEDATQIDDAKWVDLILEYWLGIGRDAAKLGTQLHSYAEFLCNGVAMPFSVDAPEYQFIHHYLDFKYNEGWSCFRTELRMFHMSPAPIAGTPDLLMYRDVTRGEGDVCREFCMVDWKRSKQISKFSFGRQKGIGPCARFPDCNLYHYTLALAIYRRILKLSYNMSVDGGLFLCVAHPNNNTFEQIELFPPADSLIDHMMGL